MGAGFGIFGKLPALGDFLRAGLPGAFTTAWDDWVQSSMLATRDALGESWDAAYLSAPIWRFSLPAGMAGPQGMTGILMASVDRVGRHYPLTLAANHGDALTGLVHFTNRTVFERLEAIALAALDDDTQRDDLIAAVSDVQLVDTHPMSDTALPYHGAHPAAQMIAAQHVLQEHGDVALWSTMMAEDHRLFVTRALPQGDEIRALFDLSAPFWTRPSIADPV